MEFALIIVVTRRRIQDANLQKAMLLQRILSRAVRSRGHDFSTCIVCVISRCRQKGVMDVRHPPISNRCKHSD